MKKLYLASLYLLSFLSKRSIQAIKQPRFKMTSFIPAFLCLGMVMWSEKTWGQLLQQDFSSSTTTSTYVNAAPNNGQFNAISTSGAGTVVSINTGGANNKLRYDRTANNNAGAFSRTTDFSPTPTTLMYRLNLTLSGTATAATSAAVFQIGSGFGTANSTEGNANTYARFALNFTTTTGAFQVRDITNSANSSNLTGIQTITWVVNNSGAATSYRAPDGTNESIADDRADIWAGTTKLFNDVTIQTTTQTITDLKFAITSGNGIVDIDDLLADPIPLIPTANAASGLLSSGFTANWATVAGVTGYRIDVSTASDFSSFVPGYENLYVAGQATNSQSITGLNSNTTYYYRVRGAAQYTVGEFASGNSGSQSTQTALANLSINDISLNEGNAGTTNFTFTVSLSAPAGPGGVTFDIATADGTATDANNDFEPQSLTSQTIAAGQSSYTFTVLVNGDGVPETNETFFVNVTNVTGATVTDAQGQGTIQNDDTCPTPNITVDENSGANPPDDGNLCIGASAILTATGGGTYVWSTSQTTSSITVTPTITTLYTVTVTNGVCVGTDTLTLHVNPLPQVFTVTGGGTYCGVGPGVEISLSGSEANATYFLYRDGQNYVTQIPGTGNALSLGFFTLSGTYRIVSSYFPGTECFTTMTGNVVITVAPAPNITVAETSGLASNDGRICLGRSATLTATGGGTYVWSTGATTAAITVTPNITTLYTVTVTNGSCVGTDTLTIHVDPLPLVFNVTGGGAYCGTGPGIAIGVDGSQLNVTYFLYRNNLSVTNIPGTGGAISFGSFTQAGTYSVVGSYSNNCFIGMTGSAVINTAGPSFTATPTNGACPESNPFVTLDVPGDSGYKYDITIGATYTGSMTTAAGGTAINEDPLEVYTFPMPPNLAGTQYTVRVIDIATGCYSDQTFTLAAIPQNCECEAPPFIELTPGSSTSCNAAMVTINYNVQNGPAIINTTGFLGVFSTNTLNDGIGTFTYTPAAGEIGTTLTIFASIADPDGDDPCIGVNTSVDINVVANPTPTITISNEFTGVATNDGITCAGGNVTLTASGGETYAWSVIEMTTAEILVAPNITTTYTVTVTTNGCSATAQQVITVNPLPTPTITVAETSGTTPNDGIICNGASVTLTTAGGGTYAWSTGATSAAITVAPNITTTYTVTVTNNGCTGTAQQVITVNPVPTPIIVISNEFTGIASNDGITCAGGNATLTATGGGTYLWSVGGLTTAGILISPFNTTTYTVTVTTNGCSATAQQVITVNPLPTPTIVVAETSGTAPNDGTICNGASVTLTTAGGTYAWSTGANTSSINVAPTITTTYTVTVTNNGCTGTAQRVITVNPVPAPAITVIETSGVAPNDGIICAGASLNLNTSGGGTYAWSNGASASSITVTPNITTTYTVTVTNNGCSGTAQRIITVNPLPTPTITVSESSGTTPNDGNICAGASTTLTASGGGSYVWSTGSSSSTITVFPNATTTYTVTVTTNGCRAMATQVITVTPPVEPTFTQLGPYCQGVVPGALPTTSLNGISGTWSPSSISTATAGNTRYYFLPSGGCADTASMLIVIRPRPDAPELADIRVCEGGETEIVAGTASAPVNNTFTWSFEGGITGTGTSQSAVIAGNAPVQTKGAGINASVQVAGTGCSAAISTNGYDPTNLNLADAVVDNEYIEFCVGTATSPNVFNGVTAINWKNRASATGPIMYALVAANNLTTPLLTGSVTANGNSCEAEGGAITLNTATCYRLYYWAAGATGGTLRIDEMIITAEYAAPASNYNFYAVDPATHPAATPVATGSRYDPATTAGSSPDTIWVTCTGANGCQSAATRVIVRVIANPTLNISPPKPVCEPNTVDVTEVDLGENPSGGTVSYHATQADAENDANPINTGLDAVSSSATFFVRYEVESGCFATGQINVVISPPSDAPELPDSIVVCVGGNTNIQFDTVKTNTFTWDFQGNITKAGVSENTDVAQHPAVQTTGAGLSSVSYQAAGSGCTDAITSAGYDITNATLADAVADNEYFQFCTGTTNPGYTYLGVSRIEWGNRISGTGPINYAVVSSSNLAVPLITGTITGTSCQIEGGVLDALSTGTCFRIYFWGATNGSGTLRIDNMEITANYKHDATYRFYAVNPATNPTAEPIAEGNSYDPGTTLASTPDTLWVTCVSGTTDCESEAVRVIVKVVDCSVSITDPCTCTGPIEQIENGTFGNNGKFTETVAVTAPSGQIWTVLGVSGLYADAALTTPFAIGTALVETPAKSGHYILQGYHQDSVGYTISVTNGNITLDTSNICFYPDPSFSGIPAVVTTSSAPFNVLGVGAHNVAGTGTFYVNNVQVGTGPTPTQVSIDPADLIVGENTLVFQFDAGYASPQSLLDPGCSKQVFQKFIVYEDICSCLAVNVSLDANCQFLLLPSIISPNCVTGTVRVMDNDPSNGGIIDCPGVWTYGLFDLEGKLICWGKVTAEDKTPPAIVCTDWFKGTLDCYDVDFVLNNHQTIGNVGATSSPRPSPGSTQTIANAEGIAGTGNCNLVPPNLVADNINNLGYTYFADNCRDCGCRTTLKWSDKVVYYSCEQMRTNGGLYAKIYRTWNATDCKGMRRDTVQEIPFARPALEDFVFNGDGEGKYDRVVTYSSCTPDKELIQKSDVMPYVCSYFNRTVAPRFSRCLYLDEVECNYSVSIKDTEFPVCGGKGLKIDRELYVFDWCTGGIVDTFHILIKIGDFEAPYLEYAHHAPFDVSTGPMDCTAAVPVSVAGIKAQFGVTIKDNCALGNVSVKVKTKDRYVKGILVAEDVWDKVDYAVMNGMIIGLPVGRHRLIIDASDGCYNALRDSFEFEVKDKIAPVMKCDDDLHVTLSNANGYTSGYAQVSADDIDEGSWDNCKLAWLAVRRNVPDACAASFIAKGYDTNGNGKLDALGADNDYSKADGFDLNGDGDIADFGETFILKGGKLMTPLADFVEFFCCDLTERVTVELWGGDTSGNTNYCWMDLLIEDKVAPTCIAPWDVTIYCDDKNIAQIDDKIASGKIFGDVTIPTGNDCAALDTVYTTVKSLKCGAGYIDRIWTLTKQTVKGPITITCKQRINILPIHEYNICFPKDISTDCKTPVIDTVLTDELACDILAVNVSDKRYDASDDECYKIFRTYTVINWCVYDDRCGDPMAEGHVYVVDRATFGNYGKAPLYVLVRDREGNVRDGNEEFYLSKDLTANNADDIRFTPPSCNPESPKFKEDGLIPIPAGEYYHSFMYTQIIKVYDDTRPVVTGVRDTFCTSPTLCTANITKVIKITDNCTDRVELETQFLMIAPFQTTDAGKMILYSTPRWSIVNVGGGIYNISVTNLPEGTHDLIVVGRDECGNLSLPTRIPFTVKDCKAPAPICINGLSTDLMPDGNGGGMMVVWATDFIASKIYDCNGQGPETKDGLKLITKYSVNRVGQPVNQNQTSINMNCADLELGFILVEVHAWDNAGNHDFCITFVEVQDNNKVCPAPADKIGIAGTITTEGASNLQGVTVTLSGSGTMLDMTEVDGNYEFVNLTKGGDFTVTPQLDKNHTNGVSTFDLVLIQKHILGIQALNSPYKMIAADANNSKTITTLDMIQIRKLILNIDTHFANNTSWRFVDASYRFPQPTNPWAASFPEVVSVNDLATNIRASFVAIKVGDVNASASINGATSAEIRSNRNFELQTQEQQLKAGAEYRVAFTAEELQNIQGYQFALSLDQSKVELLDIEYGVAKSENFGIFKNEGLITTSWNSKYEPGTLFTLVLRAKADVQLSQSLSLNRLVQAEAYDQNNDNLGIKLAFEGEQLADSYELKQNTPNPFNAETNIAFSLPKAMKATLTVRDVKGALLYKVEGNYTKGSNQVTLKKEQLGASGVLYYTLETNDFTATKKMIILQ